MIEVSELTKYYGATRAISNLSFEIQRGQIVGFLGLNGAGKSTALKILAGYLLPTSGSVCIDGVDVVAEPEAVRARIGFLPEKLPLYEEMTVRAYLRYLGRLRGLSRRAVSRRLDEVVAETDLGEYADALISTLSLGYRKRLGIAQAIIHDPTLVILDELVSGLDPVQIVQMRELVKRLGGAHTVLISSHILPEVKETCDHLLMLLDGELVAGGTEEELRASVQSSRCIEVTVRGDAEAAEKLLAAHEAVCQVDVASRHDDLATFSVSLVGDDRETVAAALVNAGFGLRRFDTAHDELESVFLAVAGGRG